MRRRVLLASTVVGALLPGTVLSQQTAMKVIGFLGSRSPENSAHMVAAFRQGLAESGFVEGLNLAIEYRWAEGRYDQLPALANDLVGRQVDVIAAGGGPAPSAAKNATLTIPIVFTIGGDPVAAGLVDSLARPGGNVTGVTFLAHELNPKRLELLRELVPQAGVIALLVNPRSAASERVMLDAQEAARTKGWELLILKASSESEIDSAFASLVQRRAGGLVIQTDPFLNNRRDQLVALAARHVVPAIYGLHEYAAAGGLISYGPSLTGVYRQMGNYAGRILKGAKPADLPVTQPTTWDLVINMKTAKTLGLTIPPSILARTDAVIE
jgi:putative ABC transport system substrate-binding protein